MNLEINDVFYKAEIRDEFSVKSIMKRYWAAQMEVLAAIDDICTRHEIRYFAAYGTLLGAVRHKGFIPWDDYIDIAMLRHDYMRFINLAQKELPSEFMLYNLNKSVECPMRIINSDRILFEPNFLERFHGCSYPVGVDIFVFDNVPGNKEEREQVFEILYSIIMWSDVLKKRQSKEGVLKLNDNDNSIRSFIENLSGFDLSNTDNLIENLAIIADNISAMYYDVETKMLL